MEFFINLETLEKGQQREDILETKREEKEHENSNNLRNSKKF
jgi:hypothetical protein